jgi:hypothetical protein
VAPFRQFQSKLQAILASIQSALGGAATGSGTSGSTTGTNGSPTNTTSAGNLSNYSQCLQAAGSNIAKMQQCAALLNK